MNKTKLALTGALLLGAAGTAGCIAQFAAAQNRSRLQDRTRSGEGQAGVLQQRIVRRRAAGSSQSFETIEIAGLKVSVWRPASAHTGPAPLVVFSHGFHGSSTQSTFLMKALADAGYLVVAPNHKDAGFGGASGMKPVVGFEKPADWTDSTYIDRADDIVRLLHAMKKDPTWASVVDWSKVALAGHSLGGYTVLGLAGAWPSWKIPEVKAVLALSPYCAPFVQKHTLKTVRVPVMYQGGTRDIGITPSVIMGHGAYDQTGGTVYFVEFDKAGHLAWTDLNPQYQPGIDYYAIAFLDKYVRGDKNSDLTRKRPDVTDLRFK